MKNFKQFLTENKLSDLWKTIVSELEFDLKYLEDEEKKIFDGIEIKVLKHYGGTDCGSVYFDVFEVTKDVESTLYRLDGHYSSYDGVNYYYGTDNFHQVKAVEKIVIEYELV